MTFFRYKRKVEALIIYHTLRIFLILTFLKNRTFYYLNADLNVLEY